MVTGTTKLTRPFTAPPLHELYPDDWRECAAYLRRQFGRSFEMVADYIRSWYGDSQNESTVRRALSSDAREKQRGCDNAYQARVRADPEKHERQKARMRRCSRDATAAKTTNGPAGPMRLRGSVRRASRVSGIRKV